MARSSEGPRHAPALLHHWVGDAHAEDGEGVNVATQTKSTHLGIRICSVPYLFAASLIITQVEPQRQ